MARTPSANLVHAHDMAQLRAIEWIQDAPDSEERERRKDLSRHILYGTGPQKITPIPERTPCKGCNDFMGPCNGGWSCPGAF